MAPKKNDYPEKTSTSAYNLVRKARIAELAGVSPKSVTIACRNGLRKAVVDKMVDLNHPEVQKYIAKHSVNKTKDYKTPNQRLKERTKPQPVMTDFNTLPSFQGLGDEEISQMVDKPLREIVLLYGNEERYKTWLESFKKVIEAQTKQLDLAHKRGELIRRDLVEKHMLGYWDGLQERLLNDAPKAITARLYALFNSGGDIETAEEVAREVISKHIKGAKEKTKRTLANA
jgi:hypothetical protein